MALPDPPTEARWCTEDLLELYAGPGIDPAAADPAIGWSTWTLEARTTCPVEIDADTGLPTDPRFQQATAIMAAGLLVAEPISASSGDRIKAESVGGYRYELAEPDTTTITEALDPAANPAVIDLIGWCLTGAQVAGGAYELTTSGTTDYYEEWCW